jgi:hypothetical protein
MVRARRAGCGLLAGTEGPRRGISDRSATGPRASDHAPTWVELDMGAEEERSETAAQHGQAVQHSIKDLRLVAIAGKEP